LIITANTTGGDAGITMNATSSVGGDSFIFKTASSERMRITSTGNVGIGTSSPSSALHVSKAGYMGQTWSNTAVSGISAFLNVYDTTYGIAIGTDQSAPLAFITNASERMRITSTGALKLSDGTLSGGGGFEMTSEAFFGARFQSGGYKFMAANNSTEYLRITSSLGTGIVYSNGGALTSTNPSDSRLKENIADITYGLSDILKLRPVSYHWKDDKINQGVQFGFIAQEVKEVMPEAIKEFGEDVKYLGLEKDAIYATLVKAIQEQNQTIKELNNRLIKLENK
jgi:hypothetical protein